RRHTRFSRDWSSDVCSSDLLYYSRVDSFANDYFITELDLNKVIKNSVKKYSKIFIHKEIRFMMDDKQKKFVHSDKKWLGFIMDQIGRASCRERVEVKGVVYT